MILKFNLLAKKVIEIKTEERRFSFVKIYFSLLFFIIFSLILMTYNNYSTIKNLEKERNRKQILLNKYKTIAKKVQDLEKVNEEIKRRIETIVNLKRNQGKTLKYFGEVIKEIQPEKLLLTNLTIQNDNAYLKGLCLDMDFLAHYMQLLENKKDIIKNINLKTAFQKEMTNLKLVEFELEVKF